MKIILITLGIIGLATLGFLGLKQDKPVGASLTPPVLSKTIDNKNISIEYTDDNTGEDLIIRADKSEISSFAGSMTTYFSVQNITKDNQSVDLVFSFPKVHQPTIWEEAGETIIDGYFLPAIPATATTSEIAPVYVEPSTKTIWKKLTSSDFTNKTQQRKDIKNAFPLKENTAFIKSGETKFFKATVRYIPSGRDEFFLEAFGSKGGYGHLDPWVFEDKFNSDTKSTGALNGQDGWSGPTDFNVQTSNNFEGNQSVLSTSSNGVIINTFTAVSAGTVYVSIRKDTQNRFGTIRLMTNSGADTYIQFGMTGTNLIMIDNGGQENLDTNFTTSQYYTFEINIISTSSFTFRFYDGTSWSSLFTSRTPSNTGAVDAIELLRGSSNSPNTGDVYYDDITTTNPFPDVVEEVIIRDDLTWFD